MAQMSFGVRRRHMNALNGGYVGFFPHSKYLHASGSQSLVSLQFSCHLNEYGTDARDRASNFQSHPRYILWNVTCWCVASQHAGVYRSIDSQRGADIVVPICFRQSPFVVLSSIVMASKDLYANSSLICSCLECGTAGSVSVRGTPVVSADFVEQDSGVSASYCTARVWNCPWTDRDITFPQWLIGLAPRYLSCLYPSCSAVQTSTALNLTLSRLTGRSIEG